MRTILWGVLLLVLGSMSHLHAQSPGQAHADTVHFRNLCRQAEQTVRTGEPASRLDDAYAQLYSCGAEYRDLLASAWTQSVREPSVPDSVLLARTSALLGATDGTIFAAALPLTKDRGLDFSRRTIAMLVVVAQLDPNLWFRATDLRTAPSQHYCSGPSIATRLDRPVGTPLPPGASRQVVDVMKEIVSSEGADTPIGRAAACVGRTAQILSER